MRQARSWPMSFRKIFNEKSAAARKKMRVIAASAVLAFSAAGGAYIGHDIAEAQNDNQLSSFTIAQASALPDGQMTEKDFRKGQLPVEAKPDLLQAARVDEFTARIDSMQHLGARLSEAMQRNPDEAAVLDSLLEDQAVAFVNDLRMAQNLSEQNYKALIKDYQARVGLDVSGKTGNYTDGMQFLQEAQLSSAFGAIFGDDLSDEEMSHEIGEMMKYGAEEHAEAGTLGGAAGGLVTGLLLMPALLFTRRRQGPHVKLPLDP